VAAEHAEKAREKAEYAKMVRLGLMADKYRKLLGYDDNRYDDNPADFRYLSLIKIEEIKDPEEAATARAVMDEISYTKIRALIAALKAGTATPGMKLGGKIILHKGFDTATYSIDPADIALIK